MVRGWTGPWARGLGWSYKESEVSRSQSRCMHEVIQEKEEGRCEEGKRRMGCTRRLRGTGFQDETLAINPTRHVVFQYNSLLGTFQSSLTFLFFFGLFFYYFCFIRLVQTQSTSPNKWLLSSVISPKWIQALIISKVYITGIISWK